MRSIGFVLFITIAALLLVNGLRSIWSGVGAGKRKWKVSPLLAGAVSLAAAAGIAAVAFRY